MKLVSAFLLLRHIYAHELSELAPVVVLYFMRCAQYPLLCCLYFLLFERQSAFRFPGSSSQHCADAQPCLLASPGAQSSLRVT